MHWIGLLIILALFSWAYQSQPHHSSKKAKKKGRLILSDTTQRVEISQYPFFVGIIEASNGTISWRCGGSIIHQQYVLTSASCLYGVPNILIQRGYLRVRGNTSILTGDFDSYRDHTIVWYSIHEDYVNSLMNAYESNIAMLRVMEPFNGVYENFINIPQEPIPVEEDYGNAVVVTWYKMIMESTNITMTPFETCRKVYRWVNLFVSDKMVCGYADARNDFCGYVRGSPLILNDQLVGIASYGRECSADHFPALYTSTAVFRRWIASNIFN